MKKKEQIIKKFFKTFSYEGYKGIWEDFLNGWYDDYIPETDKVVLCNPNRQVGIVDIKKLEKGNVYGDQWTEYDLKTQIKIRKKEAMYMAYGINVYSLPYLRDIVHKFFKGDEAFRIRIMGTEDIGLLCFDIDGEWAIALTNKYPGEIEIDYDNKGVSFVELEQDRKTDELKEIGRKFVEWINGTAKTTVTWYSVPWTKSVYKFEYYFIEIEDDLGDMMLI